MKMFFVHFLIKASNDDDEPELSPDRFKRQKNSLKSRKFLQKCVFFLVLLSTLSAVQSTKISFQKHKKSLISKDLFDVISSPCIVGFMWVKKLQFPKIRITQTQFQEQAYDDFIKDTENKFWVYCKYDQLDEERDGMKLQKYSTDWELCRQECCLPEYEKCYFKTVRNDQKTTTEESYIRLRILQTVASSQQTPLNQNTQPKPQSSSSSSPPTQAPDNSFPSQADNTSSDTGIQVLVIILACVFGVPFLLLLFFTIVSIIRICRGSSGQPIQPFGILHSTPQSPPPVPINLEDYNLDQVGPFMINPKEQCSICLDENTNLRTYCGHHYHARCIKTWFMKVKNKCPVCMGHHPNPMKVYCVKCFMAVKLTVLNEVTREIQIDEIHTVVCDGCREEQSELVSKPEKKDGEQGVGKMSKEAEDQESNKKDGRTDEERRVMQKQSIDSQRNEQDASRIRESDSGLQRQRESTQQNHAIISESSSRR